MSEASALPVWYPALARRLVSGCCQSIERLFGGPTRPNLRQEDAAWSKEGEHEGCLVRQRGHRARKSNIVGLGRQQPARHCLGPSIPDADVPQGETPGDVLEKGHLFPRGLYQGEVQVVPDDRQREGREASPGANIQDVSCVVRDEGQAGQRIEEAFSDDVG